LVFNSNLIITFDILNIYIFDRNNLEYIDSWKPNIKLLKIKIFLNHILAIGVGIRKIFLYNYIIGQQVSPLSSDLFEVGYYSDVFMEAESQTLVVSHVATAY
jgi:hypothetical protein